jgi:hypothetical protein
MSAQRVIHRPFIISVVRCKLTCEAQKGLWRGEFRHPARSKRPTRSIEPNNQNAALFIFELSRMAFPGASLLG